MNKNLILFFSVAVVLSTSGCGSIPYRTSGFAEDPACRQIYDEYDDLTPEDGDIPDDVAASPCWLRAKEERANYDLLFAEFDDQGWIQGSADRDRPSEDHLDKVFGQINALYRAHREQGLSLVVYAHGWHHNARAEDKDVRNFRWLLRDLAIAENSAGGGPRVVGIYVGWRGESIPIPWLNNVTFWERKNTAERVAQGSVRELFSFLDLLRDSARDSRGGRNVRMLTIGHSFGGLIVFESLSSDFVRSAARASADDYVSRLGDLVVIVNPAFEGARYEPLLAAGHRIKSVKKNQLPVVIVATSSSDWATRALFPLARAINTLFESQPREEWSATVRAVGHNSRYRTHRLERCEKNDASCAAACPEQRTEQRKSGSDNRPKLARDIADEYSLMEKISKRGFNPQEYLCGRMQLERTGKSVPPGNPFWVVSTTKSIIKDHGDIFNPRFVSFIRQMYLGVIAARFGSGGKPEGGVPK